MKIIKKLLIIVLLMVVASGCATHMTATKYMHSQLSYCPPNLRPGHINAFVYQGDNLSYTAPSHKLKTGVIKSLRDKLSYKAPRHIYKNGKMRHYRKELPKYKIKRR